MTALRQQMDADMVVRGMAVKTREAYLAAAPTGRWICWTIPRPRRPRGRESCASGRRVARRG